jgi:hypothetical protein
LYPLLAVLEIYLATNYELLITRIESFYGWNQCRNNSKTINNNNNINIKVIFSKQVMIS